MPVLLLPFAVARAGDDSAFAHIEFAILAGIVEVTAIPALLVSEVV